MLARKNLSYWTGVTEKECPREIIKIVIKYINANKEIEK
jgi:hypothetical protein